MSDWVMELAKHVNEELEWIRMASDVGDDNNTFVNNMPPVPDSAVSFIRYSGDAPTETFGKPLWKRNPRLQVTVRDPLDHIANERSEEIMMVLSRIKDQVIGVTNFKRVQPSGDVNEIGPDSSQRERSTVNYQIEFEGE